MGLRVYRHRGGCLVAESAPVPSGLSEVIGPWDVYDFESDPWAIWACIKRSSDPDVIGCESDLPHNARIAELSEVHSPGPRRIELSEHK